MIIPVFLVIAVTIYLILLHHYSVNTHSKYSHHSILTNSMSSSLLIKLWRYFEMIMIYISYFSIWFKMKLLILSSTITMPILPWFAFLITFTFSSNKELENPSIKEYNQDTLFLTEKYHGHLSCFKPINCYSKICWRQQRFNRT